VIQADDEAAQPSAILPPEWRVGKRPERAAAREEPDALVAAALADRARERVAPGEPHEVGRMPVEPEPRRFGRRRHDY
jgi:hypothetical protein